MFKKLALACAVLLASVGLTASHASAFSAMGSCDNTPHSTVTSFDVPDGHGNKYFAQAAISSLASVYVSGWCQVVVDTQVKVWGIDWHGWLGIGIYITNGGYYDTGISPNCCTVSNSWNGPWGVNPGGGADHCVATSWCSVFIGASDHFYIPSGTGWAVQNINTAVQPFVAGAPVTYAPLGQLWT